MRSLRFETSVVIPHPRKKVFAYVADSRNDPTWCSMVSDLKQTKGEGPAQGATYEFVQWLGRKAPRVPFQTETTVYQPDRELAWTGTGGYTSRMTFADEGAGTRITQTNTPPFDEKIRGLQRFILPKIWPRMAGKQFTALRRALDDVAP